MISGATYVGVPHTVCSGPSTTVARPKSPSFSDLAPSGYSNTSKDEHARVSEKFHLFQKKQQQCCRVCEGVYQQVLRFDVSVDDVHAVQVLQGSGQVVDHDAGVPLGVLGRGGDGIE